MIKALQMNCRNPWLETLLKQSCLNLQFIDDAQIQIVENQLKFIVSYQQQSFEIHKPASIAAIINIVEQISHGLGEKIILGDICFYPHQRLAILQKEEINLTQKEAEIILYLYNQRGYVDKATLLKAIWGYSSDILTHTLETHIYKLRNKFISKYDIIHSNEIGYALNYRSA